jgi:hypothetical protein
MNSTTTGTTKNAAENDENKDIESIVQKEKQNPHCTAPKMNGCRYLNAKTLTLSSISAWFSR